MAARTRMSGVDEAVYEEGLPTEMKAAVLFGKNDLRVVSKPLPRIAHDEVLVRVAMCGACGTDVSIQEHPFPGQPPFGSFTPGHEWTGTVVGRGASVDEIAVGDRVAIHAHHGCGRCVNCLRGRYTACENYGRREHGHRAPGFTADGGFAEYVVHHINAVYPLPDAVSWEDAVLATTAGTAVYGIDRAGGLIAGDSVVIIGPGPVGLMTTQVALALGASSVTLIGTRGSRLELGRELGATSVINVNDTDPVTAVRAATGGRGADLVIETSGAAGAPDRAMAMSRRGGTVLFLAFYDGPVPMDLGLANREEINLITARGEGRLAVGRALSLIAAKRVTGEPLVTHRYPLDDIQQGFDDLRARHGDPMKIVFVP
jgi:2-desacetyl-2-hydroxyethyl bacteriochlorophyllide A dehydrogenase